MPHHRRLPPSGPPNRPPKARTPARPDGAILKPPAPAAGGFFVWAENTVLRRRLRAAGELRLGRVASGGPFRRSLAPFARTQVQKAPGTAGPRRSHSLNAAVQAATARSAS